MKWLKYHYRSGDRLIPMLVPDSQAGLAMAQKEADGEIVPYDDGVQTIPTAQDDTDAMLVDHEYRITLLELGLSAEI